MKACVICKKTLLYPSQAHPVGRRPRLPLHDVLLDTAGHAVDVLGAVAAAGVARILLRVRVHLRRGYDMLGQQISHRSVARRDR